MAKRIGKYKLTKRETSISLTNGGSINGNLIVSSLSQSSDPGVAGQLFVTGSQWDGSGPSDMYWTGSAYVVLASGGN